jgi:hypothetical protein
MRPKTARWILDGALAADASLATVLEKAAKAAKLKAEVRTIDDAVAKLSGVSFVASSDPAVLDGCASWVNLTAQALSEVTGFERVSLGGFGAA